jgi:hypothetical protein
MMTARVTWIITSIDLLHYEYRFLAKFPRIDYNETSKKISEYAT